MRRWLGFLLFSTFAMLALGSPATAGVKWCAIDPIITVEGRSVNLAMSFPESALPSVRGAVHFEVHLPRNVTATVTYLPAPVSEEVTLVYDLPAWRASDDDDDEDEGLPMVVYARVAASAKFKTLTSATGDDVKGRTSAWGTSNRATTLAFRLR
jgi:hypothetical protein